MKHAGIRTKDIWVLLLVRPPFMVLLCYVLFGSAYFRDTDIFIPASLAAAIIMVISWRIHIYADRVLRYRFRGIMKLGKRLIIAWGLHFTIATVMISLVFLVCGWTNFLGYRFTVNSWLAGIVTGLYTNIAAIGFHEGVYMFENWKRTLIEAEALKKNNLKSRLAGLRSQVNPHFLFNSINTLSSLIEKDTARADTFLNEMCRVYRYLLRNEREEMETLAAEMHFIRSWVYILETRYGTAVKFSIDLPEEQEGYLLPPLTIFTFIEHILQTNIISRQSPLHICLHIQNSALCIRHTLAPKAPSVTAEAGRDVENTLEKFRLMALPAIRETVKGNQRELLIPLMVVPVNDPACAS